jgi:hypothetical protein
VPRQLNLRCGATAYQRNVPSSKAITDGEPAKEYRTTKSLMLKFNACQTSTFSLSSSLRGAWRPSESETSPFTT